MAEEPRRSLIPIIRLLDLDHLSLLTPITHTPPILIPYSMQYPNLINGSTYAQQKLAGGQLDESRNLALNNEALIGPCNLEIIKERFLRCVLPSNSVSKSCSMIVSAENVKIDFETKRCPSRNLQAQGYHRTAIDVSLSRVIVAFLTISQFS